MRQDGVGQWAKRMGILCALLVGLSTAVAPHDGYAQRARDNLGVGNELLRQLEALERARRGSLGSLLGEAPQELDRARRSAAEGRLPSPFGALEAPFEEGLRRTSPNTFSELELLLVEDFCTGEISAEDEQFLRVMRKFSRLERDYCIRARETVLQFGYDLFDGDFTPEVLIHGAIADDYILGIGDQLIVTFHGQESRTESVFVDREGRVILENMLPIPAAGRRFGEFRRELEARTAATFLGTGVFVSLGSVRLVSVAVVGEVRSPGLHRLTGLSTILDAIGLAGGVKKTGSLRRIQVQRGNQIFWLDLYEILISGAVGPNLGAFDGDRIFIPPIGLTVAIAGDVKRPGIYELAEGRSSITIGDLLDYSGGLLRPLGNVFYHVSFDQSGRELITERREPSATLADGAIVIVHRREDIQLGSVELLGHVRVTGRRSLESSPTVRALVTGVERLKEDPYLLLAVLETTDPATRARRLFPINLQRILTNQEDFSLRDNDRLIVLSAKDIRYLSSTDVQNVILGRPVPGLERERRPVAGTLVEEEAFQREEIPSRPRVLRGDRELESIVGRLARARGTAEGGLVEVVTAEGETVLLEVGEEEVCAGLREVAAIVSSSREGRFANAIRAIDTESELAFTNRLPCPPLFDEFVDLLPFLLEHVVAVSGEVRRPGAYPITPSTPLSSIIAVSTGLTREADLTHIELSHFVSEAAIGAPATSRRRIDLRSESARQTMVGPGDVIRFNPVFTDRDTGPVLLSGEFVRPGLYDIRRGERLSELIERGGGLTEQAYPYGAVFTRERVKKEQQAGFDRAARELSSSLSVVARRKGADAQTVLALQELSRQLQEVEALGRVVIEADPTVLQARSDLDTVLEPGDRLFMPKRPNFVSVIGDVLNPGALQFASGKKAEDYVQQAGGFQRSADEDRVFVVYPNGEAQALSLSVWNYRPAQIPPGSAIVVPKDPLPFDLMQFTLEATQLISRLAVTAASIAVIGRR